MADSSNLFSSGEASSHHPRLHSMCDIRPSDPDTEECKRSDLLKKQRTQIGTSENPFAVRAPNETQSSSGTRALVAQSTFIQASTNGQRLSTQTYGAREAE